MRKTFAEELAEITIEDIDEAIRINENPDTREGEDIDMEFINNEILEAFGNDVVFGVEYNPSGLPDLTCRAYMVYKDGEEEVAYHKRFDVALSLAFLRIVRVMKEEQITQ